MFHRMMTAALASALVLSAACGTQSPPRADATPTGTTAPVTSTSSSSANAAQGAAAGAAAAAALHGKFCSDWKQSSAKTPPGAAGAAAPATAPDMKAGVETTAAFMKTLAEQAPAEVKPDFQVMATFWGEYAALMVRNNYDLMRAATDPDFEKVMTRSEDLNRATANIDAWMTKNCS
ncbi:MAG: hypothetical protein WC211_12470 [Dehalococcoidia bacterium]